MPIQLQLHLPACEKCVEEGKTSPPVTNSVAVPIVDGPTCEAKCDNGHIMLSFFQNRRFEILFEMGAIAIIDGYFREAVSDFTASIERFLEFYVRFSMWDRGVSEPVVSPTWKEVSNQSERQLGAFLFLYALDYNRPANYLDSKTVNFINSVIHKGYIPKMDETVEFGNKVLAYLRPKVHDLKTSRSKRLHDFLLGQYLEDLRGRKPDHWWCPETILSLFGIDRDWDDANTSFKDIIENFDTVLEWRRSAHLPGFTNRSILLRTTDRPGQTETGDGS
jgi:hypothetical protein